MQEKEKRERSSGGNLDSMGLKGQEVGGLHVEPNRDCVHKVFLHRKLCDNSLFPWDSCGTYSCAQLPLFTYIPITLNMGPLIIT